MGKRQFALAAGVSLLCEQPRQGLACGQCTACQWLASGNHPDFRRIRPEAIAIEEGADQDGSDTVAKKAPSKEIRVDQLRALITGSIPPRNVAAGAWRYCLRRST